MRLFTTTVLLTLILTIWAAPGLAKIDEIKTECEPTLADSTYCYSKFAIDQDLKAIASMKVDYTEMLGKKQEVLFDYGRFVVHDGQVNKFTIVIENSSIIKVSGYIDTGSKTLWGFELLGDKSHLNSTWWEATFAYNYTTGLQAHWNLSNNTENTYNRAAWNMTPSNISYTALGHEQDWAAVFYGGAEGAHNTTAAFPFLGNHTVCMWVNFTSTDNGYIWTDSPTSMYGMIAIGNIAEGGTAKRITANIYSGGWKVCTDGTDVVAGRWYWICRVYEAANTQIRLYVNGNNTANQTGVSASATLKTWGIGQHHSGTSVKGIVDEVVYWNIVQDSDAIAELYLQGGLPYPKNVSVNVSLNVTFSPPTPDNGTTVGFDNNVVINISFTNSSVVNLVRLEWNGVNNSFSGNLSNHAAFYSGQDFNLSSGEVHRYKGWVREESGIWNDTSLRTLLVSGLTQDQIDNTVTVASVSALLLLLLVGIMAYALFFK